MESTLIVVLFTVLRLGIPVALLLIVGEAVQRHQRRSA
jgi:hypothetical protein